MEHIGAALKKFLEQSGLKAGIKKQHVLDAWPEIVGPQFAKKSRPKNISGGTLWVEAAGSSWAAQITMVRREIINKYKKRFGRLPFQEIKTTVGYFPPE
ncbi:MAG: DUF721 domain-containing protein [Candidatus Eisenbacteria bacterium]|uniref:DUF721 domain-containing protein n=1 Tax=Eiseniibacteriota bacterium TaxID=2212470 RepID=A0A948RYF2_UNCEI|nr:DUF721 domain-containing protein [Candidatus Eisenbacteria bacterium]MBU1947442.1 DUF721 domain-containing protein [Candidatus Eisenbacteria bacterium]MBU2693320.1 DUF721 domain-containing protein [Candidatus Eisenbacteria bacterium]